MAIPDGTKFHGVDPFVDTKNKGSKQANAMRGAYTIEELSQFVNEYILNNSITKIIPYFQIATPGGSDTYTQSNNIVDFDWSGGSGTYEYILPSATAIPYRKIRFVNNSTITASKRIRITAPGTETIDGGAFYSINKPYNGCAVWSDGVEWIVIQAKSE